MEDILKDVSRHVGTFGVGHYEAAVRDDGSVIITTILDNAQHTYTVNLSRAEWDRLVAWVEWQRKK
ncbi:MAG: hypothetical protein HYX82_04625 [Chloroflexi bacterium]|nr:hypothetical protein [Chloroflexota bacterium]